MKKLYPLIYLIFLISVGTSLDKVNVNKLVKHEGKYLKKNDYIPYDGIVIDTSIETGNRILKFRMISVLKSGSYEEWYLNGKFKTIGEYLNDDSTGFWTKWYASGQKEFEKNYKNGKRYGLWTHWHENGIKRVEETYEDNNRVGLCYRWYANGQKAFVGIYKNGEEKGMVTEWYENGLKREERTFKQVLTYYENGLKRERKIYRKLFTYYDTGKIKREKNYINGKEWGLEIFYHDNGKIKHKYVVYKKNDDDNSYLIFTGYNKYGKLIKGNETLWDGFEIKSGECFKDNELVDCYVPN